MCKNGYKTVNCLGPELHFKPTIWSIKKQKYICKASPSCPEVITKLAAVRDINYHDHISLAIKQRAMMLLTKNESQSDLAKELNVSDWTIRRVITNLDQFFKPNYHWLPRHIAFDDFKSGRFAPSGMSMILMNIENKQTLDIILSRKNSYLRDYFLRYDRSARLAVQTVTVDLYTPYRHLIHELFPHAIIIADHFHIVAQAYRALNKIRIQVMNRAGAATHEWRALKHFWKLLLTPANELKYNELKKAYEYYQDLIMAIAHRSKKELKNLLVIKWTQLPQALQKVQRTLRSHKQEIYNSFKYNT